MHRDRHAELLTLDRVLLGEVEGGLGDTGRHGCDARAGAVEGHHRDLEAAVLLAEDVLGGNLCVVEGDGRGVRCPLPHLVFLLVDDDRFVTRNDEGRNATVAGLGVGLCVDRVPVGVLTVGDEALGAVDDVLVADLLGGRAHTGDVGAGTRLGQAERGVLELFGEHAQVLLLDFLGAGEDDRRAREAVGAERGSDAGAAPRSLFLNQAAVEVAEARAAVGLGNVGVH